MDNFGDAPGHCGIYSLFVEWPMPENLANRLVRLRAKLVKQRLDGLIIGREDMFQGEEVPPGDDRLAYISGFTGSAGFAFITASYTSTFLLIGQLEFSQN